MFYEEQLQIAKEIRELRYSISLMMPDNPVLFGGASYSQCDEDGIINFCLSRISKKTICAKSFVEIGCSDGLENNTHQLVLDGYRGVWFDSDELKIQSLKEELGGLSFDRLLIKNSTVGANNASDLMGEAFCFLKQNDLDFLSIDIDGNDLEVTRAVLQTCSPKLICVEYNSKFRPPSRMAMKYDEIHRWDGSDYFGASLQTWVDELSAYVLVCCNLSGTNAFFVRADLSSEFTYYPTELVYQPPRYWLANGSLGHKNSLRWLRQILVN